MIDCGVSAFSKSDSAIDVGTIISTRVTFHKKFNNQPFVIASWAERYCNEYLGMVSVSSGTVNTDGFDGITILKKADSWKYNWYFYWIAIAN